jgi:hypothetical protein
MRLLHLVPFVLAAAPAFAGGTARFPFPMQAVGAELELRADVALAIAGEESVLLAGVPLPGGAVDVLLRRARADLSDLEVRLDGARIRLPEDPFASTWRGRIAGIPDSDVVLGFSSAGTRGWIQSGTDLWHLLASAGPDWTWNRARFATEDELLRGGALPPAGCDARPAPGQGRSAPVAHGLSVTSGDTRLCRVAIETDFQLYQRFGNVSALTAYLGQLLDATSARFDADVGTRIQVVQLGLHSTSNDGWTSGDTGSGAGAMLDEFRNAWSGSLPNGAHLAHFVSGASLGGGVAYLDVLCSPWWGFGVSGDLAGNTPFPVTQGPLSWDFYVFNHELGHNFGSPHTHEYCPPLDQCADASAFGPCQSVQACIANGTIMSYCHTCTGGTSNIALVFHPATAATMRAAVETSCLPVLCAAPHDYCSTSPNSYDPFGAYIDHYGSNSLAQDDLLLVTTGVPPNAYGIYYYGQNQASAPFGNGTRCVGNPAFRLPIVQANVFGETDFAVDFGQLPVGGAITAGSTWNFQLWYRNPAGGGAGFNLSNGLRIQFCP